MPVAAKKSHWLVETTERHEQTFVGTGRLPRLRHAARSRKRDLRKKYPDEPLDLLS